jgi:hypothetical protein
LAIPEIVAYLAGYPPHQHTRRKQYQAEQLSHRQPTKRNESKLNIRLARELHRESEQSVEDQKQRRGPPLHWPPPLVHKPQNAQ